jgi:uncharacterized cupin superfamily protein
MRELGDTINVPANAPHQFHNSSSQSVRMLCIFNGRTGGIFRDVGIPVATRTTAPPKLESAQAELRAKAAALVPKYRTEFLEHA